MKKPLYNFCLLLSISSITSASNFTCSGEVTSIALSPLSGLLQVNAGHGVHNLCKIQVEHNGVHPEVCKAWYSMFLSAQASGKQVHQSYSGTSGVAKSCQELGSWVVPDPMPYYVNIANQ